MDTHRYTYTHRCTQTQCTYILFLSILPNNIFLILYTYTCTIPYTVSRNIYLCVFYMFCFTYIYIKPKALPLSNLPSIAGLVSSAIKIEIQDCHFKCRIFVIYGPQEQHLVNLGKTLSGLLFFWFSLSLQVIFISWWSGYSQSTWGCDGFCLTTTCCTRILFKRKILL